MKKILQEFKKFALRGNVLDMAVGVIIGAAFGRIVTSFVNDILMPFISLLTGRVSLSELYLTIPEINNNYLPPIIVNYGMFLQQIIDFFIIALTVFVIIKIIKRIRDKYICHKPKEPEKTSKEEALLIEIRDMLKEENKKTLT